MQTPSTLKHELAVFNIIIICNAPLRQWHVDVVGWSAEADRQQSSILVLSYYFIGGGGVGVVVVYGSWCLIFISLCFKSVIERERGERLCNFLLQMQITNGHLEYREYNCEFRLFIINLMANT